MADPPGWTLSLLSQIRAVHKIDPINVPQGGSWELTQLIRLLPGQCTESIVHFFPIRRLFWVHYIFNVNCALEAHVFEHLILSGLLSWETVEPLSDGALQEEVDNCGRL